MAQRQPYDERAAQQLASLHTSLGSIEEALGNFAAMLTHFTAYHDYVIRQFGSESSAFSHSAFRMGVAMVKLKRFAEGISFLEPAAALAEKEAAATPGHGQVRNHLIWCLHYLSKAQEGSGDAAAAERTRKREEAVKKSAQTPGPRG